MKYVLSDFIINGGRPKGKKKKGMGKPKSFKGIKAFGIPPENEEPTNNGLTKAVEEGIKGWYGKLKSAELSLIREKNSPGTIAFSWGVGEGNRK